MAEEMLEQAEAQRGRAEAGPPLRAGRAPRARPRSPRSAPSSPAPSVKQLGTRQGQALVRGILGSLFKGR